MKGKCALFEVECELQKSHIIPKFVGKYFTLTGSKYIRGLANPNQRLQDIGKMDLLSLEAENKFSFYEKWFAENIFKPFQVSDLRKIEYDDKLFYFVISVLWRVVCRELKTHDYSNRPFYNDVLDAQVEWRNFLRNYIYPSTFDRIHIFLTDRIMYHDFNIKGMDYYMSRCIDATIVSNPDGSYCFVYAKFLKFVLFAYIKGDDKSKMPFTKINPIKGEIIVPQFCYDKNFLWFFVDRIEEINKLPDPSPNQQSVINEQFYKEFDELKNSEAWDIIMNDWLNLDPQ